MPDGKSGVGDAEKVVLDAAFIFDMETAQILAQLFYMPQHWLVTDFVERELLTPNVPVLKQLGLTVVQLDGGQTTLVSTLSRTYTLLSVPDLSCLVYAQAHGLPVVTRDNALRDAARSEGVKTIDTSAVLVALVDSEVVTPEEAADALQEIQDKRLNSPRQDWANLIRRWRSRSATA